MTHWREWATTAQAEKQRRHVVDLRAWRALTHVSTTGDEPYHTLKAFVFRLMLDAPRRSGLAAALQYGGE